MGNFCLFCCFLVISVRLSNTFILPLKNSNGTLDNEYVVGHLTILEQMVTTLQQTVTGQGKVISALTIEIASLKTTQLSTDRKISGLQKQLLQTSQATDDVKSLKNDVTAAKTEIRSVSNRGTTLTSQLNNQTHNFRRFCSKVNSSSTAREADLRELHQKYETLSSEVNSTDAGIRVWKPKYQELSLAVENMRGIVDDVISILTQVLTDVHSAQTDRLLLHSDVTRLNKSISTTVMKLPVQQNTGVGFESWITSSTVTNGIILKFGNIQYNSGGGYNASTGKFTAPVSGTYLFWTQVEKITGSDLRLFICKTGTNIGHFYSETGGVMTGSVITSTFLKVGQQVYVVIREAQSIGIGYRSSFGGILL